RRAARRHQRDGAPVGPVAGTGQSLPAARPVAFFRGGALDSGAVGAGTWLRPLGGVHGRVAVGAVPGRRLPRWRDLADEGAGGGLGPRPRRRDGGRTARPAAVRPGVLPS